MTTQSVSKQTQKSWWIDAGVFGSAVIAALSGIYFLFLPSGGFQGGRNSLYTIQILFNRQTWDDLQTTWDLIHTWAGVVLIAAAVTHFAIHWKWVTNGPADPLHCSERASGPLHWDKVLVNW